MFIFFCSDSVVQKQKALILYAFQGAVLKWLFRRAPYKPGKESPEVRAGALPFQFIRHLTQVKSQFNF